MRYIAIATTAAYQRYGSPFASTLGFGARHEESAVQGLVDFGIGRREPPLHTAKEIAFFQHGVACRVAMNDVPIGVDKNDRRTQSIKNIGKSCGLRLPEIDHLA